MRALLPAPLDAVDDHYLLERYRPGRRDFLRFNFIASLDGSAQLGGLSGQLGSEGDRRIFALLRRFADVVMVGSGTVHAEGYAGPLVSEQDRDWRLGRGLSAHPVLALVSRSLSVPPDAQVLTQSPAPVLLYTCEAPDDALRASYPQHVQLVQVGRAHDGPDPAQIAADLRARGLRTIHAEGGPRLFGQFIAAGCVDSLCVSYSPVLVAGDGARIAHGAREQRLELGLHTLLEEDSMLFCEYRVAG